MIDFFDDILYLLFKEILLYSIQKVFFFIILFVIIFVSMPPGLLCECVNKPSLEKTKNVNYYIFPSAKDMIQKRKKKT